jgi:hypothetical protein
VARVTTTLLLALALGVGAGPALADESARDPLNNHVSLDLGSFVLTTDTQISVDGTAGQRGTDINLEHDLGLKNKTSFRLDGYWRFAKKHKLRVMYFEQNRNATRTISKDIQFRDQLFTVNSDVTLNFKTSVGELAYEYAFLKREHYELSGTIGLHNLSFDLGLSTVPSSGGTGQSLSQTAKADGPLPVLGLRYLWRISDAFYLSAAGQFFKIKVSPYDGSLQDYNLGVTWMPWDHFGVGLGYNQFRTSLSVESTRFNGKIVWKYGGLRAWLAVTF